MLTRLAMVGVLFVTAFFAWENYKKAKDSAYIINRSGIEQLTGSVNTFIDEKLNGGPASISIFDFEILDPVLGMISILSSPETFNTVLIAVVIPVFLSVLFGRVFCGYVCPVGWLATFFASIKRRFLRKNKKLLFMTRPIMNAPVFGYILFIAILLLGIGGSHSFASLSLIHLQIQRIATSPQYPAVVFSAAGVLTAFMVFEFFLAPSVWCRFVCPSGVLYSFLSQKKLIGIAKTGTKDCPAQCSQCDDACWLHLTPGQGDAGPSCDLCLTCSLSCPQKRLTVDMLPKRFAKGEKIVLLVIILTCFVLFGKTVGAEESLPKLDKSPPWSTHVNKLDHEVWKHGKNFSAGLCVSFVEQKDEGDLYMFSAYLSPDKKDESQIDITSRITIESMGKRVSLDFDKPNAPRSTPNKAVFSGRALVDPGGCFSLNVAFPGHNRVVTLTFPEKCRAKRSSHFILGVISFGAMMIFLYIAGQMYCFLTKKKGDTYWER